MRLLRTGLAAHAAAVGAVALACSSSSTPPGAVACPTAAYIDESELPAGKPCGGGSSCKLNVYGQCGDASNNSIVDGYTCDCKDDVWQCVITSPGGGICPPTFGPYCGSTPMYGLSHQCWFCCEGPNYFNECEDYNNCYCACDPEDTKCTGACTPKRQGGPCGYVFGVLAECAGGKCASECAGQTIPDAGLGSKDGAREGAGD